MAWQTRQIGPEGHKRNYARGVVERDADKYFRMKRETLSNWSQAIPTIELSRKPVVTAKGQDLWAIESFAHQRVEK